jgi:ribosomal protein S17
MDRYLENLYTNQNEPTFLGGINGLYKAARKQFPKIKVDDVKRFLEKHDSYTRHKPVKRHGSLKTISAGLDVDHQIDLCDMRGIKEFNKNFSYILTCIDVLSKYGWGIPVKDKSAGNVSKAYQKIIDEGRKPWRVFSDKGREFKGEFKKLMDEHGIQHIMTENPIVKASLAERYNRTLKTRLYKYFTRTKTLKWLDILPNIVKAINHSVNRTTEMRPVDVTHKNDQSVYKKLYRKTKLMRKKNISKKSRFKLGDLVRISEERGPFYKGYTPNFSNELFIITKVLRRDQIVYKLKDLEGEELTSIFYEAELAKVNNDGRAV